MGRVFRTEVPSSTGEKKPPGLPAVFGVFASLVTFQLRAIASPAADGGENQK
jgi:hypothetical protein